MCLPQLIGAVVASKLAGSPSVPKVSAAPTSVDVTSGSDSLDATKDAKKRASLLQGFQSTIATSSVGDQSTATTNKKTLLGS